MKPLRGSTALLTGATGGIGPAIAERLADGGVRVVISARDEGSLEALAARLPGPAVAVAGDLADPASIETLIERAEAVAGPLDLVVHNASTEVCAAFEATRREEIERIVAVNLNAPLELTRRVLPGMIERGRGHVVFVSSLSGFGGTAFEAPYAATKGALNALSRSLRAEFDDRPVGFSLVAPGSVAGQGMFARGQAAGIEVPRALKLTTPEDVAEAVIEAVESDAPELIVYPGPIRPTLALGALAPRLSERLAARLGVARVFEPAARRGLETATPARSGKEER